MRASKRVRTQNSEVRSKAIGVPDIHISGAEGIYKESEISKISNGYIKRALNHSRGKPDRIVITIEKIKQKPEKIPLLPVTTLRCNSTCESDEIIFRNLSGVGISKTAITNGLKVLKSKKTMRGAALILIKSGLRIEPDRERGVRVSRLGIEKSAKRGLAQRLSKSRINTTAVKEALTLASKVASCPDIVAEICISDDPDYTTGYIASRIFGYLRIPNIKRYGNTTGGRVFFVMEGTEVADIIHYLEDVPALAS